MIVEHALLPVRSGAQEQFEIAFAGARSLIEKQPGFIELQLSRSIQIPDQYLLLVWWESVAAHTEGFRRSAEYAHWKQALHHFYGPFPVVEYFNPVCGLAGTCSAGQSR